MIWAVCLGLGPISFTAQPCAAASHYRMTRLDYKGICEIVKGPKISADVGFVPLMICFNSHRLDATPDNDV